MAGVFDRPMFSMGTGGTMEDTGFQYPNPKPFGYGVGQVDPGIPEALKQRSFSGSQIVQGGDYTNRDVPDLRAKFQGLRNDLLMKIREVQTSSDPNKFEIINELQSKLAKLDQERDKTVALADRVTYTAEEKYGKLPGGGTPFYSTEARGPMPPELMDIFQNISERAATSGLPAVMPKTTPSDMETDARGQSVRTFMDGKPLTAAGLPAFKGALENQAGPSGMEMEARRLQPASPTAPKVDTRSTMEADARDRGPLALSPADVAAGLNNPKPEVQEKTAADFAKQFADMSPKYEGLDKGLMLAQIGFAIAAGESPNAMKNIADGLSAGADMMIKDKQAKNEFDRQVQLSAMQYGLGEAGKIEAEKRAMAREGKNGNFFVADKPLEFGGRKYSPGDNVFVPNSQLWEGGLPAGLSTESSYSALQTAQATVQKALIEAQKNNVIDGDQYKMVMTGLNDAADSYSQATKILPILEASLIRVADGQVTGFAPALGTAFNQAANAIGLKPESDYESKEKYTADLEKVTVQMVGDILGEGGKTISDNDRRIVAGIAATLNDLKSGVISDPDIVVSKIQDLMTTLESNKRKATELYATYMKDYGGTQTMSGAPFGSIYAERVFQSPTISYSIGDDGIYRLSTKGQ